MKKDVHSLSPFAKQNQPTKNNILPSHLIPPSNIEHKKTNMSPQPTLFRKEFSQVSFFDTQSRNFNGVSYQSISTQASDQQINGQKTPTFGLRREDSSPNFSRNFTDLSGNMQVQKQQSETGANLIGKAYQTSNFFNV